MNTSKKNFLHRTLNIDLVEYLDSLGIRPTGMKEDQVFFQPDLPGKETLVVDTKLNIMWSDYLPTGNGNILDFGTQYHNTDIPGFLELIRDTFPFRNNETRHPDQIRNEALPPREPVEIITIHDNMDHPLMQDRLYSLNLREEDLKGIAQRVTFNQGSNVMEGIVHRNDSGGLILNDGQHPYLKGKMDITTVDKHSRTVDVFNNIYDYLALRSIRSGIMKDENNAVVLNSDYLFEKARPFMEKHAQINLFLNHSPTSRDYVGYAKWLDPQRYKDFGAMYKKEHMLMVFNLLRTETKGKNRGMGL